MPARIVAVADYFDAVTHDRPYRPAWSPAEAVHRVSEEMGVQFDPQVVGAFLQTTAASVARLRSGPPGAVA